MWRRGVGGVTAGLMVVLGSACGSDAAGPGASASTTSLPTIESAATTTTTTIASTTTTLAEYYEVQAGDSLSVIAQKFDVRLDDLVAINEITNPDHIQVGDKLRIPPPTILLNDVTTTVAGASSSSP